MDIYRIILDVATASVLLVLFILNLKSKSRISKGFIYASILLTIVIATRIEYLMNHGGF